MARKKHYNFYDDAFKATAVSLSEIPGIKANHVAEVLDIHEVMLYRWRQEFKEGRLSENKHRVIKPPPPKTSHEDRLALKAAESRIKELEKQLAAKNEEVVILPVATMIGGRERIVSVRNMTQSWCLK